MTERDLSPAAKALRKRRLADPLRNPKISGQQRNRRSSEGAGDIVSFTSVYGVSGSGDCDDGGSSC